MWRDYCLEALDTGGRISWASEGTWRASYVLSFGHTGAKRPRLRKTKVRVYSDTLYQSFVVAGTELEPEWLARETMQTVDAQSLSVEEFSRCFEQRSRPMILKGCATDWPAMHLWSKESLLRRFGEVTFACGQFLWILQKTILANIWLVSWVCWS